MKKQRFYCDKCGIVEFEPWFTINEEGVSVPVHFMSEEAFIRLEQQEFGISRADILANLETKREKLYHAEYGDEDFKEHYVGEFACWVDQP